MRIIINTEKCTGCAECLASCSYNAIEIKGEKSFINEDCQLCKMCLSVCPEGAIIEIAGREMNLKPDYQSTWQPTVVYGFLRNSVTEESLQWLTSSWEPAEDLQMN